ncbi:MAG: hypothetical protein COA86_17320 [Kangiella sp.]|nr:MAG: hypothetical protein COA86_17320 [Kangiella sp.]
MSKTISKNPPKKHALLIGIDRYSHMEEQYQLRGCVNDAKLMKSVLIDHFKFSESNITELHDAEASQQRILDAMENLVDKIEQDDIVVFHFSGHGSQRKSAYSDEGTGMNSTISTTDTGCEDPFPNLDIIDDVINEWLTRLASKTRYISLTFDCCHSGTITRDALGARARGLPADTRSLSAMGVDKTKLPPATRSRGDAVKPSGWLALNDNYVVISGCRDDELSYEDVFEGGGEPVRHGALTLFLTNALMKAKPGWTYRDVFELARNGVNSKFKQQHPQIEGVQDREIFGINDIETLQFISVVSVEGKTVTLAGGVAHGLCVGSLWAVYPNGTKKTQGITPLASIEITEVRSLTAQGIISEGEGKITVGARCVESAISAKQFLLSVDVSQIEEEAVKEISERINASNLLTLSKSPGIADVCAYILRPEHKVREGITLPSTINIDVPTWAIVDRTRELAMPLHAVSGKKAIETIISNLEAIARYRNALKLNNPDSELKVEFNIFHVDSDGELHNINDKDFVFEEGQNLAFEVINHEPNNVFVTLLDFGLNGKISLFYPTKTSSELIAPGKTIKIGADERKIKLSVPSDFVGNQGTETVKAIITSEESDFRWLQQEGTRSVGAKRSSLRQQFEAAYDGPPTRNMSFETEEDTDEDWKAITRSFELKRRAI